LIIKTHKKNSIAVLMPVLGISIFIALYIISALFYPGGSQADKNAVGFSWINNYWCNLIADTSINGQTNTAKPFAMTGMLMLCIALIVFWFLFPQLLHTGKRLKSVIQISGTVAMIIAFFLFTDLNHDLIIDLASVFGLIATTGVFIGLYNAKWFRLFSVGFLSIVLIAANNYVYYTKGMIVYLPVIQKITFASFLIWICCIDIQLFILERERGAQKRSTNISLGINTELNNRTEDR
jgi:hypothetical protein